MTSLRAVATTNTSTGAMLDTGAWHNQMKWENTYNLMGAKSIS
jgi:hypothetical protein